MKVENVSNFNLLLNQKSLAGNEHYVEILKDKSKDLFPVPNSIFSRFFDTSDKVSNFLSTIFNIQESFAQYNVSQIRGEARPTNELRKYLEYPSDKIEETVNTIVDKDDNNDEKMYKIEQWVIENFEYKLDIKNYGESEYWATPTETLRKGSGDCEDGAFLIHSLGLSAGVPEDRLRTYGGLVVYENEKGGIESGGHGWTAYKRESDDQWVVLDFSFFTTDKKLDQRQGMEDDFRYFEDWFFVNLKNTVDTPYSNAIREPDQHSGYSEYKGVAINKYA